MLGTGLQFTRGRGENRFYGSAKPRRAHQNQKSDQLRRAQSDVTASQWPSSVKEKPAVLVDSDSENPAASWEQLPKPVASLPVASRFSSLERFLESITPSRPSSTSPRRVTCNFSLTLFLEIYGSLSRNGVPLVLNDSDCVIQYYVLYLSGIQIFGKSMKLCAKPSQRSEDSDSDFRDSSRDYSTDCEPERALKCSGEQSNHHHLMKESP